jgi:hypothetical protein
VVLSSHNARYALLPWSANLVREDEWRAFAQHVFADTYGLASSGWEIRVSPSPRGAARVACAVEQGLLGQIRRAVSEAGAKLVSVQPGLMHAFNVHRRDFRDAPGWIVLADEGRLTLALIARGLWELLRVRNVGPRWRDELDAMLRREEALAKRPSPVERVVLA